jgi:7-keto-8-aminopelargonate synthetase-like enzyme
MERSQLQQHLDTVTANMTRARLEGIAHQSTEDETLEGRHITLSGQSLVNFGSCSYLGLEQHPTIKAGAIDALTRYGTQFSSSRAYVSLGLYEELESELGQMFGGETLVTASTSLGHMAALPVLIGERDALILDHQVHASVNMAAQLLKARGNRVEVIRHNHLGMLENRLQKLADTHEHIWYLADGLYSMYGDFAPFAELRELLDRYEQLHLYIDDAHSISWTGKHGAGAAAPVLAGHPRVVIAASLNKSFAAAGGALVFPNAEMKQRVRDCGGPLIFSGPIQPPMLGAALASVRLHATAEVADRQAYLLRLIHLFNREAAAYELPVFSTEASPICFVSVGKPDVGYNMARRLIGHGYYLNLAAYPSVPYKNTGLRMTLHHHLKPQDIMNMVRHIARELPEALAEEQSSLHDIQRAFGVSMAS